MTLSMQRYRFHSRKPYHRIETSNKTCWSIVNFITSKSIFWTPRNKKTTLSQRIQTGSGGEHQIPFYLAHCGRLDLLVRLRMKPWREISLWIPLGHVWRWRLTKIDMVKNLNVYGRFHERHRTASKSPRATQNDKRAVWPLHDTIISVWREGGCEFHWRSLPKEKGQVLLNGESQHLLTPA